MFGGVLFWVLIVFISYPEWTKSLSTPSPTTISTFSNAAIALRQKLSGPSAIEITNAIANVSRLTSSPRKIAWDEALDVGSPWITHFSVKPDVLKEALQIETNEKIAEVVDPPSSSDRRAVGKFYSKGLGRLDIIRDGVDNEGQGFGKIINSISLLMGLLRFQFHGTYKMVGPRMNLAFERLRIRLFWIMSFSFNIRDDDEANKKKNSWILQLIERKRGGNERQTNQKIKDKSDNNSSGEAVGKKKPNVFVWCYVDENVCVARGSSGSVALWVSNLIPKNEEKN